MLFWVKSSSILEVDGGINPHIWLDIEGKRGEENHWLFLFPVLKFLHLQGTGMFHLLFCQSQFCPPSRPSSTLDSPSDFPNYICWPFYFIFKQCSIYLSTTKIHVDRCISVFFLKKRHKLRTRLHPLRVHSLSCSHSR